MGAAICKRVIVFVFLKSVFFEAEERRLLSRPDEDYLFPLVTSILDCLVIFLRADDGNRLLQSQITMT